MPDILPKSHPVSPFIAVVDDDASVRNALERLLKSLGHEVVTYANANDFLRAPHFMETSCLILDVQMPGISGLDLQSVVSALRVPMPIIFITAHEDEGVRARALALGAIGFLEKPFDDEALATLINKAVTSQS